MTAAGNSGPVSPGAPGNLYLVLMLVTFYFSEEPLSFEKLKIYFCWVFFSFSDEKLQFSVESKALLWSGPYWGTYRLL